MVEASMLKGETNYNVDFELGQKLLLVLIDTPLLLALLLYVLMLSCFQLLYSQLLFWVITYHIKW